MTRLSGETLLAIAEQVVPVCYSDREDRVQDVALALVQADPSTKAIALQYAQRAAHAARMRDARRIGNVTITLEQIELPTVDRLEQRQALDVALAWQRRHGRPPSRTTMWRICRGLKQNP